MDPVPTLGRFRLLRRLGEGAQATVWLAHDPLLDREVAIKVLQPGTELGSVDEWLHEARAVSRLNHPHIVPVFEADTQNGQSYLVFEYVEGGTLADRLRDHRRMPAREAVGLLLAVLDALTAAHAAGIVHRDLKPTNILLDTRGRPRVMDFGIAARVSASAALVAHPERIVGTPGYLSPEAAEGRAPHPSMDVFAAAVLLAEMLSGTRLNHDPDPWRAVRRVREQDLQLPHGLNPDVDDALRAIVQRGLARDPQHRWPSARALHDALLAWLRPAEVPNATSAEAPVLDFLLRRMRHRSDFPAMSEAIGRIQRLTQSDTESLSNLSNEILKDVALTQKLLRLVNTVGFRHAGGGTISTVSRAVALIGFAGIRNLALSLVLLERMENKGHAQRLREEFLRCLMSGSLARELCHDPGAGEEAFLCALFHHLGRMLTEFYFPEEAEAVRRYLQPSESGAPTLSEAAASAKVLGMSYEQLGLGVAREWGLPEALQNAMHRPVGEAPGRLIENTAERQRWLARAANDVADLILHTPPAEVHARVVALAQRHARALGVGADEFDAAADRARQRLAQMSEAMQILLPRDSVAQRLLAPLTAAPQDSLAPHQLQATIKLDRTQTLVHEHDDRESATQMLAAGIQDITDAMVEQFQLNAVLRMILETIYRALRFRRVIFCLRDSRGQTLTGRLGVGEGVERLAPQMRIELGAQARDLFAAVCTKGADTCIEDVRTIANRLPAWYAGELRGSSFLLLPLMVKGAPLGLIYADKVSTNGIELGEKELSLLRTLRNQAVMAFRQAGG